MMSPFSTLFAPPNPVGGPPAPPPAAPMAPMTSAAPAAPSAPAMPMAPAPAARLPVPPAPAFGARPQPKAGFNLATLLPALLAGIKDPMVVGHAVAGLQNGMERRKAALESAQQTQDRRAGEQADFYGRALQNAQQFDDPIAFEQWRQAITPMAQHFGIDPGVFTFSQEKKAAKDRKLVSDALDVAVKQHGPEILNRDDVSLQLSDGRTLNMATARQMVGGGVTAGGRNVPMAVSHQGDFTLNPGDTRFGPDGKQIATGGAKPEPKGTLEQQYLDAIQTGNTKLAAQLKQAANIRDNPPAGSGFLTSGTGTGLRGDAYLATIPPAQRELIKKIANYEMDLSKVTSLRGGEREQVASMVAQYDPTFDMSQYASRSKLRADFNSGKGSQNIRSLNTAVGHLATLKEKAAALENRSSPLWNAIANRVETGTGDPRVVAFNTAATAVEGELASLFKGTGAATDAEIKQWRASLDSSQSPAQQTAAIQTAIELMHSRLAAMDSQWEQGMGKPRDFKILTDRSRAILDKMGVDVTAFDPESGTAPGGGAGAIVVTAPDGSKHPFETQAQADTFKKLAGIK